MTTDHRAEAERLLASAAHHCNENPPDMRIAEVAAWIGQGYATLARDEEQAARTADMRDALRLLRGREYDVRKLVSTHIAKALASREPNRWKAGRELAQALDMADCNMDEAIDARLSDDGWDPRSAWKAPASAVRSDDPWAATPDITADIPEPVVRVIAGHLAEMLLGNQSEDVHQWARGVAFELKRVGADITPAIEKRIHELTLGPDPSTPPF
ncbi:post-segregation antitoxin (ccd killing protein) [Streptomyces sp. B3I7]|uniref:hypothetical protein n=1 Tax=Streptomyces sp. B3I7 TaxID=3042269 RepID=UPI00278AEB16|nr:hypothetical protein [Streptomyces sp. B3I7]MDQ0809903.1 post-segregation antitoxin (ccd killing protein) [Streptomyces sp. B3I7]